MTFQDEPNLIRWKIHLKSSPQTVYEKLSTNDGRASFWAESALETDGIIYFVFPNLAEWKGRILESERPHRYAVEYYGGSITTFELISDGSTGTDLALTDQGVPKEDRAEVMAGWVLLTGWVDSRELASASRASSTTHPSLTTRTAHLGRPPTPIKPRTSSTRAAAPAIRRPPS